MDDGSKQSLLLFEAGNVGLGGRLLVAAVEKLGEQVRVAAGAAASAGVKTPVIAGFHDGRDGRRRLEAGDGR